MLGGISISSFADELEKISYETSSELADVAPKMKPGDLVVTQPRPHALEGKPLKKTIRYFLKRFQSTPYTHVGMYVGDNRIVDSDWAREGVKSLPLKRYAKDYSFRVLRVNAKPAEKKDAVEYVKSQVGKPFAIGKMLRVALPVGRSKEKRERQEAEALYCSELIANAYHNQNFSAGKSIEHVRPVDIQKSPLTKIVAELK